MTDAVGALGSGRLSYDRPQSRQRSIAAANRERELERPIPKRVAAIKPIETAAQETN